MKKVSPLLTLLVIAASAVMTGCGSSDASASAEEQKAFKNPDKSALKPPPASAYKPPENFKSSLSNEVQPPAQAGGPPSAGN